ncbi:MAG TPA: hypothetical protein VHS79_05275 [Actinomycetes bacterium]|jgi:hypothetical protein|nr:hypothetical protein [Actinomycetota bacterium]HEX2156383.1 hypothetical protein [Actinomycetes bacterium]
MTPDPRLEDRLRGALRRPDGLAWPDEHGAFDQFLHRRTRRGRALAARGALALVVAVALAAGIPRLLPGRPVVPAAPPLSGRVVQVPGGGFEVAVPAGWTDLLGSRRIVTPASEIGSGVALRPMRRAANTMVMLYTGTLSPAQYPGIEPGGGDPDPSVSADRATERLEDRGGPLGRGRRPDGRPYVWQQTLLGSNEVAKYAIAWPYHCTAEQACPPAARWRALFVHGVSEEGPATRARVLEVVRRVVEEVRPVTNALPGGALGSVDLAVPPVKGRWRLGTGGKGQGAWEASVRQGDEDVFELEFPARRTRPGVGMRAEDIEPTILLRGQLGVLRDCLSWLKPQVGLVSGVVPENVTTLRISMAGRPPLTVRAFGHDRPARWAAFVSPPLARGTRVTRVVALDAGGRTVAESERDSLLSHPVCHVFR